MVSRNSTISKWEPGAESFQTLLAWLDGDEHSRSQSYERMRYRLVAYFDRKHCHNSAELADLTFDRVTKWVEKKHAKALSDTTSAAHLFEDEPAKICFNTARFVYHEWQRKSVYMSVEISDLSPSTHHIKSMEASSQEREANMRHQRLDCLDKCLETWPPETRSLLLDYYGGTGRDKSRKRQQMADHLNISSKNLTLRALRYRGKLELCVKQCVIDACEAHC